MVVSRHLSPTSYSVQGYGAPSRVVSPRGARPTAECASAHHEARLVVRARRHPGIPI